MRHLRFLALFGLAILLFWQTTGLCASTGMVTFVFDDGLESVYQYAYPVLSGFGLPATVGVIANRMESADPEFMGESQLHALQKAGWEIASHGLNHKRPIDIPKFFSDENCLPLRRIPGEYGLFDAKYQYEQLAGILEHDRPLTARASAREVRSEPGTYYFDQLIGEVTVHPFDPEHAEKEGLRAVSYQRELADSKALLAARGFAVTTFVTPHNYWTPEMSRLSQQYYGQVTNGGDDCNRRGQSNRFWLKRFVVHSDDSAGSIIALVKEHAIGENAWVIFCMHGVGSQLGWEPWDAAKLSRLAAFLKEQGVPVVTVAEGAKRWFAGGDAPGLEARP